jgi:superfamily II DNA/RNA helicase
MFRIVHENENSKLNAIKEVATSMKEPVLIFAQYKKVLRDIKLCLVKTGLPNVFLLEGNITQRSHILDEFKKKGGVLLLCAADSFAGIRCQNAKYIIFSHALLGDYNKVKSLEIQAIGRVLDTTDKTINVMSFVAEEQEEYIFKSNHASS